MADNREARADALAGELRRQRVGHLTLFLGAAPGVGKTYAMLSRARELRQQGVDLVVGVVETHGRSETAALVDGHEVIARRQLDYQGHRLSEMDLDAIVRRQPHIVLVDELAHRNAPGSRHERRWQDVLELLDNGIDVYSTVNIQHLESLNDIVHRITGVRVSETVPDALLDRLRDIRLVDLPPGELIERLHQGKIYLPDMAEQALQRFFSAANLAALRELALQTAADHVDDHLRESQAALGISGMGLRRRVMIAIDGSGNSEYLVRAGRRIAERRDAPWSVVTVQRAGTPEPPRQAELDRAFALARNLGADTQVLHGSAIADTLLDHAAHDAVSTLVVGRSRERPVARMFNRTITQRLLQHGAHYELVIVSSPAARGRARSRRRATAPAAWLAGREASYASAAAGAATGFAWLAERWVGLTDLSMIFIVAVVVVAARTRMAAAVLAALLCFLAYNFFFIEPRYTLLIAARWGITTVVLFLLAALVAGRLASQLRMQVLTLRAANNQASVLQHLGRQLSAAADLQQVLQAGRTTLERAFGATAMLQAGTHQEASADLQLAPLDRAAADWALTHGQPAGRHTETLAGAAWWFLPLPGNDQVMGVIGLQENDRSRPLTTENRRLAEAICMDIAQAALRTTLVADLEAARVANETERLRSALLSSVSHDLRSPLAAMMGSASSLINYAAAMSEDDRVSLLQTIQLEGERLDRYIQNLLDMTRLGHDSLTLHRSWIGVDELVGSAAGRLRRYRPQVMIDLRLNADLPPLWVHPALVEQSLFNVLENAAKFSPAGSSIEIFARQVDGQLQLDVQDRGPGIAEEERSRIFDMFYSMEHGDCGRQGTGLGLTIAQGMIGAHGGSVSAFVGEGGQGTLIRLSIPLRAPGEPGEEIDHGV